MCLTTVSPGKEKWQLKVTVQICLLSISVSLLSIHVCGVIYFVFMLFIFSLLYFCRI